MGNDSAGFFARSSPPSNAFDCNCSFEAENGIKQEATGELRTVGEADVMVMSGSYEYTGADGELYRVNWYADETGYHAEAEHLPRHGLPLISFQSEKVAIFVQTR